MNSKHIYQRDKNLQTVTLDYMRVLFPVHPLHIGKQFGSHTEMANPTSNNEKFNIERLLQNGNNNIISLFHPGKTGLISCFYPFIILVFIVFRWTVFLNTRGVGGKHMQKLKCYACA